MGISRDMLRTTLAVSMCPKRAVFANGGNLLTSGALATSIARTLHSAGVLATLGKLRAGV